jgi:uncharacterized protein
MDNIKEKKIAVVGVSHKEDKYGFKIFQDLVKADFKVEGINLSGGEVAGRKLYRSLQELPVKPDIVITVVPPPVTEKVIEACRDLGIKQIWMQPGSESDTAVKKAQEYGIAVIHNACFMVTHGIW